MSKSKLQLAALRFETLFGPEGHSTTSLPQHLKTLVYERMSYSFLEVDGRKFRSIKMHFIKTFHPDTPDSIFTSKERQAVFVTIPHIFEGEELA